MLVSCNSNSRNNSQAGHPVCRRCSSVKYAQYSPSSRLGRRAPRQGLYSANYCYRTLGAHGLVTGDRSGVAGPGPESHTRYVSGDTASSAAKADCEKFSAVRHSLRVFGLTRRPQCHRVAPDTAAGPYRQRPCRRWPIRVSGHERPILNNRSSKFPIEPVEMGRGTVRTKPGQMVRKRFPNHPDR